MPTAYSKNDHANGKERHEEILPLASKAGWNVPKTKVDGNDIRQLRYPQKKPCEGNRANHQTGNINNQTEPFSIHGPHPIAQPYIEVRGLLFPVALKRPLSCEPTDTRNDMAEIERRGLGQRFDSLVARTGVRKLKGTGLLHQISMVKRSQRHWVPPFLRHQYTNFSLLERSYGICFSLMERSLRSIFAQCFLLPHMLDQVLAHVGDRKADHAV